MNKFVQIVLLVAFIISLSIGTCWGQAEVALSALAPSAGVPQSALLTPPMDGGPVVVRAAFHLQDINEIDEEAETFEFTGIL